MTGSGSATEAGPQSRVPLAIIVAVAENGVIGRDGTLPWYLPEDLRRFRRLTMGHSLLLGRRTYESIGRPLPGRRSFVLTRNPSWSAPGVTVVADLAAGLDAARAAEVEHQPESPCVFVIGGAAVYREALPLANRLYRTRVKSHVPGDTFFPEIDLSLWRPVAPEETGGGTGDTPAYVFETLDRVR